MKFKYFDGAKDSEFREFKSFPKGKGLDSKELKSLDQFYITLGENLPASMIHNFISSFATIDENAMCRINIYKINSFLATTCYITYMYKSEQNESIINTNIENAIKIIFNGIVVGGDFNASSLDKKKIPILGLLSGEKMRLPGFQFNNNVWKLSTQILIATIKHIAHHECYRSILYIKYAFKCSLESMNEDIGHYVSVLYFKLLAS